jgi:hypothetical protein
MEAGLLSNATFVGPEAHASSVRTVYTGHALRCEVCETAGVSRRPFAGPRRLHD